MMGTPSLAHHSAVAFDRGETIIVSGTVTKFVWRNPHLSICINVEKDGVTELWRIEGDTLVVETDNFVADAWGIHTGISSSEKKHLVERFTMSDDGLKLAAEITVTDPVYLSEPKTFPPHWRKLVDRDVVQAPCTMEAAMLYLEGDR